MVVYRRYLRNIADTCYNTSPLVDLRVGKGVDVVLVVGTKYYE